MADTCPAHIHDFLLAQFKLTSAELYQVKGPVNLVRLNAVPDLVDRPDLKFPPRNAGRLKALRKNGSVFKLVKQSPILLHHPYQSFDPVVQMIREAAADPDVLAVKMTIYRTGSNSELVRALMKAALAGKQVTVVVELMARFDEANNVNWAKQLEEGGVRTSCTAYSATKSMPKWLWLSGAKTVCSSVMPTSVPVTTTKAHRAFTPTSASSLPTIRLLPM